MNFFKLLKNERNVTNFQCIIETRFNKKLQKKITKIWKYPYEFRKNHYWTSILNNYFFDQFINTFSALLLCKIKVLDIFDMADFLTFSLYREVLKFWSNQNFGWEHICHTSLIFCPDILDYNYTNIYLWNVCY